MEARQTQTVTRLQYVEKDSHCKKLHTSDKSHKNWIFITKKYILVRTEIDLFGIDYVNVQFIPVLKRLVCYLNLVTMTLDETCLF